MVPLGKINGKAPSGALVKRSFPGRRSPHRMVDKVLNGINFKRSGEAFANREYGRGTFKAFRWLFMG